MLFLTAVYTLTFYIQENEKKFVNCGRVYRDCIKRNGDKTQMQSTHHIALGFMGIVMT